MTDDLVSRKEVLNTLNRMDKALDTDRTVETYKELLEECYECWRCGCGCMTIHHNVRD